MKKEMFYMVQMQNTDDFKYLVGIFSTGAKAEAAARYERHRRHTGNLPGKYTALISKVRVDQMEVPISVEALEELINFPK